MVSAFTERTCLHIQFRISVIPLLQIEPEGKNELIIVKINEVIAYCNFTNHSTSVFLPDEKCLVLIYLLEGEGFEKSFQWQEVFLVCILS